MRFLIRKILALHLISLVVVAGTSTLLIGRHLIGPVHDLQFQLWRLFFSFLAIGAGVLGIGGFVRSGSTLWLSMLKGDDINGFVKREEACQLLFFGSEILVSVAVLAIAGVLRLEFN